MSGNSRLRCSEITKLIARRGRQVVQHAQLLGGERELADVAADDVAAGRHDIVDVEQAVGKGDGELVDLTSEDHVAEVDQAADVAVADVEVADVGAGGAGGRVLVDEHVVVVGVVVHDRAAQHRQQWHRVGCAGGARPR